MNIKLTKSETSHFTNKYQPSNSIQGCHEKQSFKFISNQYSKYLNCPLCKALMIRPMRIHPCGHTFCSKCIEPILSISKQVCPIQVCSKICKIVQNDRTAEGLIDELKVECTNDGCVWRGCYDNYKKTHKDSCLLKDGGLGRWLSQLKKGINIIPKQSVLNFEQKKVDQDEKNHSFNSENQFEKAQKNQFQKIGHNQAIQSNKQNQIEKKQIIKSQKPQYEQGQQINNSMRICQENIQKIEEESNIRDQSDNIQLNQPQFGNPITHIEPQQTTRRVSNNLWIYSIPFGPSIEDRSAQMRRKKQIYIQKELKKLQ